jgi:hypothetical protein
MIIPLRANYLLNDSLCPRVLVEEDKSAKDITHILHKLKFVRTKSRKEELVKRILNVKDLFSNPIRFDSHVDVLVGEKDYLEEVFLNDFYFLINNPRAYRAGWNRRAVNDLMSLKNFGLNEGIYSIGYLRNRLNINRMSL